MGTCCGPCHDRRFEGGEAPAALAFSLAPRACLALAFSPDGRTLGLGQGGVWRRDLATGATEKLPLQGQAGRDRLAFTSDGGRLLVVEKDGLAVVDLDGEPPAEAFRWSFGRTAAPVSCDEALSPDGRLVAFSEGKGRVEVRRATDGGLHLSLETGSNRPTSGIGFSSDGKLLAAASWDGPLRVWDARAGGLRWEFTDEMHPTSLAFTADGALLAGMSSLRSNEVRLWDLVGGEELPALTVPRGPSRWGRRLCCVAFSPTGRILVAGGNEGTLSAWDLDAADRARLELQWSESDILCLASSGDGRWLAAGDNSASGLYPALVRLWPWAALRSLLAAAQNPSPW
jgi:WD40 repeat protein